MLRYLDLRSKVTYLPFPLCPDLKGTSLDETRSANYCYYYHYYLCNCLRRSSLVLSSTATCKLEWYSYGIQYIASPPCYFCSRLFSSPSPLVCSRALLASHPSKVATFAEQIPRNSLRFGTFPVVRLPILPFPVQDKTTVQAFCLTYCLLR